MSRARLAIGTFGEIGFLAAGPGRVTARARYRDWDGRTRLVQVTAGTRALAERALKVKLSTRSFFQPTASVLTPDSLFSHLVDYWLEDLDQEGRLSTTTRQLYERNMRTLVLPAIGNLTLREIGVARCDQLLKQLNKRSYSRAKHARVVLRLAFGLAVRHEVLSRNPMDHVPRLNRQTTDHYARRTHPGRSNNDPHGDRRMGERPRDLRPEAGWTARWNRRGDARNIRPNRRGARDSTARR
jgi:hypothetical protein